jgi:hypothetical protein
MLPPSKMATILPVLFNMLRLRILYMLHALSVIKHSASHNFPNFFLPPTTRLNLVDDTSGIIFLAARFLEPPISVLSLACEQTPIQICTQRLKRLDVATHHEQQCSDLENLLTSDDPFEINSGDRRLRRDIVRVLVQNIPIQRTEIIMLHCMRDIGVDVWASLFETSPLQTICFLTVSIDKISELVCTPRGSDIQGSNMASIYIIGQLCDGST